MERTSTQKRVRGPERGREGLAKRHKGIGLSAPRRRFIEEYMKDRNCLRACLRAGYSTSYAKTRGWRLLRMEEIRQEIDRRTHAAAEKADADVVDILRDLKRIAHFDIGEIFDEHGKIITDPRRLSEEVRRGLVGFEIIVLDRAGDYIVKLNPGNRLRALELWGKHLCMFSDRVDVDQRTTVRFVTDYGTEADDTSSKEASA